MILLTAQLLLAYLATILCLGSTAFLLGGSIGGWAAWLALPLATLGVFFRLRPRIAVLSQAILFCLFIIGGALIIANLFYDVSYDGEVYHQEAIRQLANGWNPWHQYLERNMSHSAILLDHYARGPWIYGAAFYSATGQLETGKAAHLILLAAALLYSVSALRQMGSRYLTAWLIAAAVALNPVAIYQSLSFYIDGQLASLLLCLAAAAALYLKGDRRQEIGIVSAIVLAANVKFTGIVYAVLWSVLFLAALWFGHRRDAIRHFVVTALAGGVLGAVVIGWNPYMTNLFYYGHPFYPLYGAGANNMDIMTLNFPTGFAQLNMLSKLVMANLVESSNGFDNLAPILKWPFALRPAELAPFVYGADVRLGGFGPWFSGIALLTLLLLPGLVRERKRTKAALLMALAILLTVLINPEAWWARYAPQIWLLPAVVAWAAFQTDCRWQRFGGVLVLVAMAVNIFLVGAAYGLGNYYATSAYRQEAALLAARPQPLKLWFGVFNSNEVRMKELGVPFVVADEGPQDDQIDSSFRYRYLVAVHKQPGMVEIFRDEKERLRRVNNETE
ncbi:hypothetical protein [Azotosporobacter soli]|uniref:hypothetical protein n=1 Tax=Azotosporobacter soli TaxID=3055040 RepID=UPI0031FE7A4F